MTGERHPLAGLGDGAIATRHATVWRCMGDGFWGQLTGELRIDPKHYTSLTWRAWVIAFPVPEGEEK